MPPLITVTPSVAAGAITALVPVSLLVSASIPPPDRTGVSLVCNGTVNDSSAAMTTVDTVSSVAVDVSSLVGASSGSDGRVAVGAFNLSYYFPQRLVLAGARTLLVTVQCVDAYGQTAVAGAISYSVSRKTPLQLLHAYVRNM